MTGASFLNNQFPVAMAVGLLIRLFDTLPLHRSDDTCIVRRATRPGSSTASTTTLYHEP